MGSSAGDILSSGHSNTIIGAGADSPDERFDNQIIIGSGSVGLASNTTVIGNDSTETTYLRGNISGSAASTGSFGHVEVNGAWQAGFEGNADYIALTAGDFNLHDNTGTREYGPTVQNEGSHISVNSTGVNAFAMKIIPKGFSATGATVYGSSTGACTWRAYSSSIDVGTDSTGITNVTNIGSSDDFSTAITGDGKQYCVLRVDIGATGDDIHGGQIDLIKT